MLDRFDVSGRVGRGDDNPKIELVVTGVGVALEDLLRDRFYFVSVG
jgi:hypothetical protein